MPRYTYRCPECGVKVEHSTSIARRDNVACGPCSDQNGRTCLMERQPDAPNFTLKGYTAKNGYSKLE